MTATTSSPFTTLLSDVLTLMLLPLLLPFVVVHRYLLYCEAKKDDASSSTAYVVLLARVLLHVAGYRTDAVAVQLFRSSPVCPPWVVAAPFFASLAVLRAVLTRVHGGPLTHVACPLRFDLLQVAVARYQMRSLFFDGHIAASAPVGQLVLFGAGFDSRALDVPALGGLADAVFEVDRAGTQAAKKQLIARAGLTSAASTVTFVECDFSVEEDPWTKVLHDTGFDRAKPFVALWEGVTMYLTQEEVARFLRGAAAAMAGNSRACLLFDFIVEGGLSSASIRFGAQLRAKEPWLGFLPVDVGAWLTAQGVALHVSALQETDGYAVVCLKAPH